MIGSTPETMTNIEALTVPVRPPKSTFRPFSDTKTLGSGLVRGVGFPVATWTWAVIDRAERDALRAFCSGQSAAVYIKTKTMESSDTYKTFSAIMVWNTQAEERDTGHKRVNLSITFQALVEVVA
jgi:hypothetical protein